MLIPGEWYLCDDGEVRPVFRAGVLAVDGNWIPVEFLIDTGADQTTLTALVWSSLGLDPLPDTGKVVGLGAVSTAAIVESSMRLLDSENRWVVLNAPFFVVTDPLALEMSVLGRDLLNLFALIVDRLGDRVFLLSQRHSYQIVETRA